MTDKKDLWLIFCFFFLYLNVSIIVSAYNDNHKNYEVITREVTIIKKYTAGVSSTSESHYMTGEDDEGNYYKILGHTADIGDEITIYANPNSSNYNGNDPEWDTSEARLKTGNNVRIGIFSICSIFIVLIIIAIMTEKDSITKSG